MRGLAVLVLIAGLATPCFAQGAAQPPVPAPDPEPAIDATKLGVSLSRIQRGLFIARERDRISGDAMHLEFNVQVYGQSPKIELLKGIDLFNGGVPGSAPSHNQMIEFWTPAIYRSPTMPVSTLAFWAASQIVKKGQKARCEEEISQYRQLIMQGVSVSAPRCTQ